MYCVRCLTSTSYKVYIKTCILKFYTVLNHTSCSLLCIKSFPFAQAAGKKRNIGLSEVEVKLHKFLAIILGRDEWSPWRSSQGKRCVVCSIGG
jgi:hypothetical protein